MKYVIVSGYNSKHNFETNLISNTMLGNQLLDNGYTYKLQLGKYENSIEQSYLIELTKISMDVINLGVIYEQESIAFFCIRDKIEKIFDEVKYKKHIEVKTKGLFLNLEKLTVDGIFDKIEFYFDPFLLKFTHLYASSHLNSITYIFDDIKSVNFRVKDIKDIIDLIE